MARTQRSSGSGAAGAALLCTAALLVACRPAAERYLLTASGRPIPVVTLEAKDADAKLPRSLREAEGDGALQALIDLAVQVDLEALGAQLAAARTPRLERRRIVVAALEQVAAATQAALEPELARLERRGLIHHRRGFAVVNRLLVEATPEGLRALARLPQVAAVAAETESREAVWATSPTLAPPRPSASWAIAAIGAPEAWRLGLDGRGVVVGILDSGASAAHRQLAGNFRRGPGGWHDPAGASAEPRDGAYGHGTGVLSCAVGQNLDGVTLGVAPGAEWVACAALPDGRFNNLRLTECADWMLTAAQPDVLINAWSLPAPGCDPSFRRIVDAWRAAEMLPVFAAGNHGPGPGSGRSPANYSGLYPGDSEAFAVGGIGPTDAPFPRSSVGPSACGGATFPSLVAPAEGVTAALPLTPTTYVQAEGTSFAAGLAAGAAALLLERHPEASVVEIEAALRQGAVDLGPRGPDDRFGHGRLDLPRSLGALARMLPAAPADASEDGAADG